MLKYLSVCSGIEAVSVAWKDLPFQAIGFSEIEKFPSEVLKFHYPHVKNYGNMLDINKSSFQEKIDILIGGTPCQAFSVAGNKNSLDDERGNLTLKFVELANATNPTFIIWENVLGVFNTKDNAFGKFIGALSGTSELFPKKRWTNAGYVLGRKRNIAWRVLNSQYFGVPQRRRRVFLIASDTDRDPRKILFESKSSRGLFEACENKATHNTRKTKSSTGRNSENIIFYENHSNDSRLIEKNICPSLTSKMGTGGNNVHLVQEFNVYSNHQINSMLKEVSIFPTVLASWDNCSSLPLIQENFSRVRKLTPLECERLQGFPDNYTQIPYNNKSKEHCPDSHRYKAIGNSMAVPVIKWIGQRILDYEKEQKQ